MKNSNSFTSLLCLKMDQLSAVSLSTLSEFISLKLYDKLITELRCPGCSMPMKPPIHLCKTGHSVCEDCTKILESCVLCKGEFTMTRNLTLEALCSKAEFPCENSVSGCRVRCTTSLLEWHEKQCSYRLVKCFIGKVWGGCEWKGCEKNWLEHINKNHLDKVFTLNPTELNCHIRNEFLKPLTAYYIFQMYNQVFSFYQIYDKINRRLLWTMSYEPKDDNGDKNVKTKYAFEIEIYDHRNPLKAIIQKYECHHNGDRNILRDGACATLSVGDALCFIDDRKILHYRVKIHKINNNQNVSTRDIKEPIPIDFQQTSFEGGNYKQVPSNFIITRKVEESVLSSSSEIDTIQRSNSDSIVKLPSSDSDSDSEFEEFVNNLFKRKFQMTSKSDEQGNLSQTMAKRRKQYIFKSFTKSYNDIKTSFIELKLLHKRKSKNEEILNNLEH